MEKKKSKIQEIFKAISRVVVSNCIRFYCKIVYKYEILGRENIPKEGALIFCGNHRSYLDPPLIVVTCPRKMRFMAKEELRKNGLFGFLCYIYNSIFVKRDSKDIGPLKEAMKELKNGECIGIFPEGTRNGMDKNDGKLKNGASYMSLKTGAKLVPIGIKGEAKPWHKVTLTYGKPLDFSDMLKDKSAKELEDYVSERLKEEIIKLSSEN
ncbi:MAG: 1-acyl-sn-glycerol-3-phosphate acyltransferase [Clostridia bacterium]|nr:1-acyl-sn-glycerol-3-phosphate acyltransferase [Clostridia bacterium]